MNNTSEWTSLNHIICTVKSETSFSMLLWNTLQTRYFTISQGISLFPGSETHFKKTAKGSPFLLGQHPQVSLKTDNKGISNQANLFTQYFSEKQASQIQVYYPAGRKTSCIL